MRRKLLYRLVRKGHFKEVIPVLNAEGKEGVSNATIQTKGVGERSRLKEP